MVLFHVRMLGPSDGLNASMLTSINMQHAVIQNQYNIGCVLKADILELKTCSFVWSPYALPSTFSSFSRGPQEPRMPMWSEQHQVLLGWSMVSDEKQK